MIDVDLNIIRKNLEELEKTEDSSQANTLLYEIAFSSSRMLLVTRGAEPHSNIEVFDQFISLFINEGLISDNFRQLIEKIRNHNTTQLITEKNQIKTLAQTVVDLYENMDDSLQFKSAPKVNLNQEVTQINEFKQTNIPEKIKDFRGVACPMNFVKTKIELSTLGAGSLLEIWLDDGQPIQNVPGSVRNEGHEILSLVQVDEYWKILIRKKI